MAAGVLTLDVTIAPNTRAAVPLPGRDDASVTKSGRAARSAPGVTLLRAENDRVEYQVGSGVYHFQTAYAPADEN